MGGHLKWLPGDKYYIQSDPPGYTICRVSNGKEWIYELWREKRLIAMKRGDKATCIQELKDCALTLSTTPAQQK